MIIVEGPDGGGKTTLAKKIVEKFDLDYRRPPENLLSSTHGPSEGLPQWWRDQLRLGARASKHGVYDRCFYISEAIYQLAQPERELLVSEADFRAGIYDLWAENPYLIFCIPPYDVQLSNVIQDGRASLKGLQNKHLEKISFLYSAYAAMWGNAIFENLTIYDYTNDKPEQIFEWLQERGYQC